MPDYDLLADFYNRDWGDEYHSQIMGILDRLLLDVAPSAATILDVCCGTGRVAARLIERGFGVIGIDESLPMIECARQNAGSATFHHLDSRCFALDAQVYAAISTFESLNHILDAEGLARCFRSVYASIERAFVFDLNREPAFEKFWNGDSMIEKDGVICEMHSTYDCGERLARCRIQLQGREFEVSQRCHDEETVMRLLSEAGFSQVERFDSARDLSMTGDVAFARTFFRCTR